MLQTSLSGSLLQKMSKGALGKNTPLLGSWAADIADRALQDPLPPLRQCIPSSKLYKIYGYMLRSASP